MTLPSPDKPQLETFPTALAFGVALLPMLAVVWLFFPDSADCAPGTAGCGSLLTRFYALGTLQAALVILGGIALLAWLALGLRYVYGKLTTLPRAHARNVIFLYALLTCAAFFLLLPLAVVTVLIVAVCAEIVIRLAPQKPD